MEGKSWSQTSPHETSGKNGIRLYIHLKKQGVPPKSDTSQITVHFPKMRTMFSDVNVLSKCHDVYTLPENITQRHSPCGV